jgi:SAM-dependent methyltransferase
LHTRREEEERMTVHPDAAIGFARAAAAYERGRPGYPPEAVAWLRDRVGITVGRRILDLAAGTGKLTRMLVPTGATLVAADPVHAMLRALDTATGGAAQAVVAIAQALPLPDGAVDGIVVAQAFHWFATDDALAEMARVLAPDGTIALVWNSRRLDDPLQGAITGIVEPHRGDAPAHATGRWRDAIDRSPYVRLTNTRTVPHSVRCDIDGLVDRVLSISFVAALDEAGRAEVERDVRALEQRFGATPVLRYRCEVHLLTPR